MRVKTASIQSMTGYGRATRRIGRASILVEVRSTNHRYLEIDQRLPNGYLAIQGRVAEMSRRYVRRGKIDLAINLQSLDRHKARRVVFDEVLLQGYYEALRKLKMRFRLKGDLTLEHLLALPQAVSIAEEPEPVERLENPILETAQAALKGLVQSRRREGEKLLADLRGQLVAIERLMRTVKTRLPKALEQQRQALREKIQSLLGFDGAGSSRIEEAVALVKEVDVHEELVRLASHLSHLRQTLAHGPLIGKRLDFIAQELMREVNTIGAKGNDPQAARLIVEMKGHIEKIREQAQNLE